MMKVTDVVFLNHMLCYVMLPFIPIPYHMPYHYHYHNSYLLILGTILIMASSSPRPYSAYIVEAVRTAGNVDSSFCCLSILSHVYHGMGHGFGYGYDRW